MFFFESRLAPFSFIKNENTEFHTGSSEQIKEKLTGFLGWIARKFSILALYYKTELAEHFSFLTTEIQFFFLFFLVFISSPPNLPPAFHLVLVTSSSVAEGPASPSSIELLAPKS
jgi:hypothetical protein